MPRKRSKIGQRRSEQIVQAAVAIIAEEGLQQLSLSAIEQRAGMSRGQLTYYFPTKEAILLAVFDHMLATLHARTGAGNPPADGTADEDEGWERLRGFLTCFLLHPPDLPEFHALQFTFLSQVGHRQDYRQRLAGLYEQWRTQLAEDVAGDLPASTVSARTFASLVQAILHGLILQRVADPDAYDREEMKTLCLDLLGTYLGKSHPPAPVKNPAGSDGPRRRTRRRKS